MDRNSIIKIKEKALQSLGNFDSSNEFTEKTDQAPLTNVSSTPSRVENKDFTNTIKNVSELKESGYLVYDQLFNVVQMNAKASEMFNSQGSFKASQSLISLFSNTVCCEIEQWLNNTNAVEFNVYLSAGKCLTLKKIRPPEKNDDHGFISITENTST